MNAVEEKATNQSSGTEIEEEIGQLSSQLAEKRPDAPPPSMPGETQKSLLDSPWLAGALLAIALALTIINLVGPGLFGDGEKSNIGVQSADPLRDTLLFAVEEVEAFRDENGRLPSRLEEIGMTEDFGVILTPTGNTSYTLTATIDGESLSYTSTQDPAAFFGKLWSGE